MAFLEKTCSLFVAFLAAIPATGFGQKPDVRVDTGFTGSASLEPEIAVEGSSIYVAWLDLRLGNFRPFFNRSHDGGATWLSSDVRLRAMAGGGTSSLQIAASGDHVHVVWADSRDSQFDVYHRVSTDRGATWSAEQRLDTDSPGAGDSLYPQIAVSGSEVHVAWQDHRHDATRLTGAIYYNRSLDAGVTWEASDVRLDRPAVDVTVADPGIALTDAAVHVVWRDVRSGSVQAYANRSTDRGATWMPQEFVLSGRQQGSVYDLQVTSSSTRIYVVWTNVFGAESDVYVNGSRDDGATWFSTPVRVDAAPAGATAGHPQIAAVGDLVYAIWEDNRFAPRVEVMANRSVDAANTWLSSDRRVATDPVAFRDARHPQIAAAGFEVFAAWADSRNGRWDIYYNRSPDAGASWHPTDLRLDSGNPGAARSEKPALVLGPAGAYVVWEDDRATGLGGQDIYFNLAHGYQPYGAVAAGTGGAVPTFAVEGRPTLGGPVQLELANGLGGAIGVWLAGTRGTPPGFGGALSVIPQFAVPVALSGAAGVAGAGAASLPLTVPTDSSAVGMPIALQAVVLDGGAPLGLAVASAIELWIG